MAHLLKRLTNLLSDTADVVMPRNCPVCGKSLDRDESYLCRACRMSVPYTQYETIEFNPMEQLFAGKVPIERATGGFFYEKGSPYASILHDLKYRNMPRLGEWMAAEVARRVMPSGFFEGIDAIVPVPLHRSKLAKRGYNQSECIARGISQVTGIPISLAVDATMAHNTQTHKGAFDRWLNTRGIYAPCERITRRLHDCHLLLVDDVVTTGATLQACAAALQSIPGLTLSIMTLAVARLE